MAIDLKDIPYLNQAKPSIESKLQVHAELRRLILKAGAYCKGDTLVKIAEAIVYIEAEIDAFEQEFGGIPLESLQRYGYDPNKEQ